MTTTVETHQSTYNGGGRRSIGITNGSGRVGLTITESYGKTIETLGMTPREAAEAGRALLCAAINAVEGDWGGTTDEDAKAISALDDARIWG